MSVWNSNKWLNYDKIFGFILIFYSFLHMCDATYSYIKKYIRAKAMTATILLQNEHLIYRYTNPFFFILIEIHSSQHRIKHIALFPFQTN